MLTVERGSARVRVSTSRFFLWMSVAFVIVLLWGFGPTYFFRAFITTRELTPYLHVHGVIFAGWFALLLVQTALVAARRTPVHRQLGVAGMVLAAAVTIVGTLAPIFATPERTSQWHALNGVLAKADGLARTASSPILFAGLATAGLLWRRRPEVHKRLMLLASIAIINAAVMRALDDIGWPLVLGPFGFEAERGLLTALPDFFDVGFGNVFVMPFVAALAVYDWRTTRRVHWTTMAGGLAILLFEPVARFGIALLRA